MTNPETSDPPATTYSAAWNLRLATFGGIVAGATHYMARLAGCTLDVEVNYVMTADDAARLSEPTYEYLAGTWSTRFHTRADALDAALAVFAVMAGPRDVLVSEYNPGEVFAGPDDLVAAGRALHDDEDGWYAWVDRFREHAAPAGADTPPPPPRRSVSVVVERDGTGWRVIRLPRDEAT
jgi:hypothetical protein